MKFFRNYLDTNLSLLVKPKHKNPYPVTCLTVLHLPTHKIFLLFNVLNILKPIQSIFGKSKTLSEPTQMEPRNMFRQQKQL